MVIRLLARCRTRPCHRLFSSSAPSDPLIRSIDRVLIANRGEIAIRVMRTARRLGIETVAVYSDADRNSMHVKTADRAYHIGPPAASQSYLNAQLIIETAIRAGAQAIHPGYGFLSENANFAELCSSAGLVFVGPPVKAIRDMGTKSLAKQIMQDANVPVVQGFHGKDQSDANLRVHSKQIGYPVMLKAVYGGGGKGMRIAWNDEEFQEKLNSARSEAKKSFGNDEMLVEKFVEKPRHVEVQVFGDHHGSHVYLWERDCSVQRRHQKIVEEAPAPLVSQETRVRIGESATRAAAAVGYVGAGTVEFILDPRGNFYFMEMNTRLQVEHPVTEAITGTDLVEWQFRVAQGEPLPLKQEEIKLNGHALECRVYAEDTKAGFMPTAGLLEHASFPSFARVDTGVASGDEVSVHYDPMIAKVIVWGADRTSAIQKLDAALAATHIAGLSTNISFVRSLLAHKEFVKGNVYTDFIRDFGDDLFAAKSLSSEAVVEGVIGKVLVEKYSSAALPQPFSTIPFFRVNHALERIVKLDEKNVLVKFRTPQDWTLSFDGKTIDVHVSDERKDGDSIHFVVESSASRWTGTAVKLSQSVLVYGLDENEWAVSTLEDVEHAGEGEASTEARAPMPGVIERILVKNGDEVTAGTPLVVMIAMKMEYIIKAPQAALIESVNCAVGDNVAKNSVLVRFGQDAEPA